MRLNSHLMSFIYVEHFLTCYSVSQNVSNSIRYTGNCDAPGTISETVTRS
jgi:hypothetical protein